MEIGRRGSRPGKAGTRFSNRHEYVGVVEEVGGAVTTIRPGQFVIGSFFASDNTCEICRAGYQTSCVHRQPMGTLGSQAQRLRVPLADGTLVATPDPPPDDGDDLRDRCLGLRWDRPGMDQGCSRAQRGGGSANLALRSQTHPERTSDERQRQGVSRAPHERTHPKEKGMTTDIPAETSLDQARTVGEKIALLRKLFVDAPEVGRTALENVLRRLASDASQKPPPPVESAGRVGSRLGKVSELTIIVPFAPGGADRLRAFLRLFGGNLAGADDVGTVHDMRFVFLDDDTRMLFATAYDGDWDAYIDDFATKIPDFLEIIDSAWEGWPGICSPEAKDYLAKYQVTAEGWYVANDLTVAETRRLRRLGEAVDEFLDKVGD